MLDCLLSAVWVAFSHLWAVSFPFVLFPSVKFTWATLGANFGFGSARRRCLVPSIPELKLTRKKHRLPQTTSTRLPLRRRPAHELASRKWRHLFEWAVLTGILWPAEATYFVDPASAEEF